jgi:hypothetical protein
MYNEFAKQLERIKSDFKKENGRDIETIKDLTDFVEKRLLIPKSGGIRSLKGII